LVIFRYLAKEVFLTLASLTAILMLIFLSNQLVQYLNRAASGGIPGVIIMKLMMLEVPNLIGLLLPLGFYVALLLSYGRLYAESEMTVLRASGYGPGHLLKHSLIMATGVALCVAVMVLWAGPSIAIERAKLLRATGVKTLIQTLMPARFHSIDGAKKVFYVQAMNRDHTRAEHVFLAGKTPQDNTLRWDILWADSAYAETDPTTGEEYVILQDGKEYQGIPGQANAQVTEFKEYKTRLPHPTITISDDIRTSNTAKLWLNKENSIEKTVELQWRLSIPLMVFTLTIMAVPLSRVSPRSGKFARLLPAIIVYIVYANMMFIMRDALVSGKIPSWIGLWGLHVVVGILGLFMFWRSKVTLS
jgi:lipopolysaccharide export system permease protein